MCSAFRYPLYISKNIHPLLGFEQGQNFLLKNFCSYTMFNTKNSVWIIDSIKLEKRTIFLSIKF